MGKHDDLFVDTRQSEHNHTERGIKPEGKCPRCDEWWRWHNKVKENPAPIVRVETAKKRRGRPKKDEAQSSE